MEGVKQLRNSELKPLLVFIMPPSIEELEKRLTGRNTETAESLKKRLDAASSEIEFGEGNLYGSGRIRPVSSRNDPFSGRAPGNFDQIIVNHNLEQAYDVLSKFIVGELKVQIRSGVRVDLERVDLE